MQPDSAMMGTNIIIDYLANHAERAAAFAQGYGVPRRSWSATSSSGDMEL